jgi:hypothetical protein
MSKVWYVVEVGLFFFVAIITIMEGLGLFFSYCHKYSRWKKIFVRFFLVAIITIMEGLGLFFLIAISTIGGEIYFSFLSRCNDEEEQ